MSERAPEKNLWQAVITRALLDAFSGGTSGECVFNRNSAIAFLTATSGPLAQSRAFVCDAAGVCHKKLRTRFLFLSAAQKKRGLKARLKEGRDEKNVLV